jgi:hypothetical protein
MNKQATLTVFRAISLPVTDRPPFGLDKSLQAPHSCQKQDNQQGTYTKENK